MPEKAGEVFEAMKNPETYDVHPKKIDVIQTHISWVFLTGEFVYKVKKPVNFGFLDFSTLEKRKQFCFRELEINRMFSPEIYIDVLPINRFGGSLKMGGPGMAEDYAIKMRQLPQDRLMTLLLEKNLVTRRHMDELIQILERFYSKTKTFRDSGSPGDLDSVELNWKENFEQSEKYVGILLEKKEFDAIKRKISSFMKQNAALFHHRKKNGFVKWCHGDLHSGNIFVTDSIHIFDAIEFNDRFAISDIASDIAFMAMDLDFRGSKDLADYFVNRFIEKSGDMEIEKLLPFYMCYRAFVRGKVLGFRMDDSHVPAQEKEKAREAAKRYFEFAYQYSKEI
jgi:aminoglycoside phosphotransferase family enzyme